MASAPVIGLIERDRAAAPVDPSTLTEAEKAAKILALQQRVEEMELIATILANLLQGVETVAERGNGMSDATRKLLMGITHRRWECAMPVTIVEPIVEPETGATSLIRRAL